MSVRKASGQSTNKGQFKKGQTGNPKGRPRKCVTTATNSASAFNIVMNKTLSVTHHGVSRELTMEEALQYRTYQDAIAGKRMAERQVLKWIEKREAWLGKRNRQSLMPQINTLWEYDSDNADAAMLILGIVQEQPNGAMAGSAKPELLLEPWVVQAALKRRRGRKPLDQKDLHEVLRCTRDAASLCLPSGCLR